VGLVDTITKYMSILPGDPLIKEIIQAYQAVEKL
jgi:hypothetical protein